MGKTNHRGRNVCKDQDCTTEIENGKKYCAGHQYLIGRWLKKSEALLAKALQTQAKEIA